MNQFSHHINFIELICTILMLIHRFMSIYIDILPHFIHTSTNLVFFLFIPGITAFWRGVIPPLASVAPLNALGFTSYHKGLDLLTTRFGSPVASRPPRPIPSATPEQLATLVASLQRDISPSITADFIKRNSTYTDTTPLAHRPDLRYAFAAGCISGLLSVLIAVPAEFVKVQEQNSAVHRSPYIVARDIVKAHGWRALYRGFWATAWRDFPSVGLYFWSYEYVKWYFRHETLVPKVVARQPTSSSNFDIPISVDWQYTTKPTTAGILTAGGIAGALSWASTYPFDIMKTQIQSLSHREYLKHGRIIDVYRQIVQQKGHKFFLAGGLTTIVRAVPVNAVTFYCFEETSAFLKRQRFCMGPPEAYAQ